MVIETCPKCGHDLMNLVLTCNPPIPQKICTHCGWSWTGKGEEVVRVPFREPSDDNLIKKENTNLSEFTERSVLNAPSELMEALDINKMLTPTLDDLDLTKSVDIPPSCRGCSNHPSNGGSGICHCILGLPEVTC